MSALPRIAAVAALDARSLSSSSGLSVSWAELGVEAPGRGQTFRQLFGRPDATFRRLDRMTRALVLATEACALESLLPAALREETALVVETTHSSLEVDLRYTRSLADGIVQGAIFPYTLQSTCLGDVALRLGLRGPTVSFSIEEHAEGEALREAARLFADGGARLAVVGRADALDRPIGGLAPALRAVVALAVAPGVELPGADLPPVAPWPADAREPFGLLAAACRDAHAPRAATQNGLHPGAMRAGAAE